MRSKKSQELEKKRKEINRKRKELGRDTLRHRNKEDKEPGLSDRHIQKIKTSAIINRLNSFVMDEEGEVEMAPHKVTAALGLLKKVVPDLSSTHNTQGQEKSHAQWVDELNREGDEEEAQG